MREVFVRFLVRGVDMTYSGKIDGARTVKEVMDSFVASYTKHAPLRLGGNNSESFINTHDIVWFEAFLEEPTT